MLRKYPDTILSSPSVPVSQYLIPFLGGRIKLMRKVMRENGGYGLAGVQIGILSQMFIITDEVFYNPVITKYGERKGQIKEGCLSVDGEYMVERSLEIWAEFLDAGGRLIKGGVTGMKAIIFQHEYDHLQGITIVDKGRKVK